MELPLKINDLRPIMAQSGLRNGFSHSPRDQEVWGFVTQPLCGWSRAPYLGLEVPHTLVQTELRALLRRHQIPYDEKHLWD
jgi:hypothetical protein